MSHHLWSLFLIGVTSLTTSAVNAIGNYVIGEKIAAILEEDTLLALLAWEAREALVAAERKQIELQQEQQRQQLLLLDQQKHQQQQQQLVEVIIEEELGKKEKKKKLKLEKKEMKETKKKEKKEKKEAKKKQEEEEELEKKRKKKEKKKKKKNKKGDEKEEDDEEEDEDEGDKGVSATKPNSMWWLVPAPLDDGDGKQLSLNDKKKKKEAKEAVKRHTVEIAATQSALFATKQVAGKTAGMVGVAAVSVNQCAGHWKADNKNKVEAKQWHSYMAVHHLLPQRN